MAAIPDSSTTTPKKSKSKRRTANASPIGSLISFNCLSHSIATHVTRSSTSNDTEEKNSTCIYNNSPGKIHLSLQKIVGEIVHLEPSTSIVSVPSTRKQASSVYAGTGDSGRRWSLGASYIEFLIELQRPKQEILHRWLRYSELRHLANDKFGDGSAIMESFPRKTNLFESSLDPMFIQTRRSEIESFCARQIQANNGGLEWMVELLG